MFIVTMTDGNVSLHLVYIYVLLHRGWCQVSDISTEVSSDWYHVTTSDIDNVVELLLTDQWLHLGGRERQWPLLMIWPFISTYRLPMCRSRKPKAYRGRTTLLSFYKGTCAFFSLKIAPPFLALGSLCGKCVWYWHRIPANRRQSTAPTQPLVEWVKNYTLSAGRSRCCDFVKSTS